MHMDYCDWITIDLLPPPHHRPPHFTLLSNNVFNPQYMMDPIHELVRVDQAKEVHCMDDAFTLSLKALVSPRPQFNAILVPER